MENNMNSIAQRKKDIINANKDLKEEYTLRKVKDEYYLITNKLVDKDVPCIWDSEFIGYPIIAATVKIGELPLLNMNYVHLNL